ncbi:mechanosensitive ion channel family protein [Pseudodesulfovibrio pelocollis]|uniref:mechanosensitive ion channel family protein n=1 Tax=Pseudodesulfovibrio pelocollis TaxID=3051432 RepID=UPI00255AAC52|nr:mechanosensitive ion channel domain-containing protein [Pseudodesulfovibrio sp. SB368]
MIADPIPTLAETAPALETAIRAAVLLAAALAAYLIARFVAVRLARTLVPRSQSVFAILLMEEGVFARAALLAPAPVLSMGAELFPASATLLREAVGVYLSVTVVLILLPTINALVRLYETYEVSRRRPIKGYAQLFKLFISILGAVSVIALLLGQSPWGLLSGIGAMTAVLMLIFRDTILSLVAGVQIGANDLLRKGDWIEMPAMAADGDVIDVALHTVKVQNWDKTITAIPTHKFLDTPFKNWRGMTQAGGRRIKRSLLIDLSSIRFADDALLERLAAVQSLAPHIARRRTEIEEHNARVGADARSPLNGRRMTNVGLFRLYALDYVTNHPGTRTDMTLLVRQLQPAAEGGLPLEIYCFTNDTAWSAYEGIQSDIFDHLLAALPHFGLRAYQRDALVDVRATDCA